MPVRLRLTLAALLAIALLAGSTGAWAHPVVVEVVTVEAEPSTAAEPTTAAAPPVLVAPVDTRATTMPVALVLSLALAVAGGAAAPRRALALTLVLVLSVLALEPGIHSVHHLGDLQAASQCESPRSRRTCTAPLPQAPPRGRGCPRPSAPCLASEFGQPRRPSIRPDEGRAPPTA